MLKINFSAIVDFGYVSEELQVETIKTKPLPGIGRGTYQTSVTFLPKEVGDYLLCLQSFNLSRF